MEKLLIGNGGAVLMIRDNEYYILNEDESAMQRVNFEEFVKEVERFRNLYEHTWSKEFKRQYEDILEYIGEKV